MILPEELQLPTFCIFLKITYRFQHFYLVSIAGRLIQGPLKDDSTILLQQQGSLVCSAEKKKGKLVHPFILCYLYQRKFKQKF